LKYRSNTLAKGVFDFVTYFWHNSVSFMDKRILPLVFIALLTFVEFRVVSRVIREGIDKAVTISQDTVKRHPPLKAHQTRIIGPWIIDALAHTLNIPPKQAYHLFLLLGLIASNISFYFFVARLTGDPGKAMVYLYVFIGFFLACIFDFLLPWDILTLLLFSIFAYGVFARKPPVYFLILLPFALLNREDALFIPLWLVINSLDEDQQSKRLMIRKKLAFAASSLLFISSIILLILLRNLMFQGTQPVELAWLNGNCFELFNNIQRLFYYNFIDRNLDIVVLSGIVLLAYYLYQNREKIRISFYRRKIFVLFSCLFLFDILMGYVNETRIFFHLVPFIVFFMVIFDGNNKQDKTLLDY